MKFDNFRFRCSALGKIMSAKGELTTGNKTYLREIFTEVVEGKRKEITSKYFEKGKFMEEDGVTMINETLYPKALLVKNKERRFNDFIEGECDLDHDGIVWDIKNAWDLYTFGKADLTDEYEWQGRGYMWLWNREKFRLYYCLNNMPEHMLIEEERKMFYRHNFISTEDREYLKLCEELRAFHNYDNRPIEQRFKIWEIERTEETEEKIKAKVIKCRAYLNDLWEERQASIAYNLALMGIDPSVILAEYDNDSNLVIVK